MLVMLREEPDEHKTDWEYTHSSHPDMTTTQISNTPHLPPLLALPVELKLQIFSYLKNDSQPSLMLLRRTHSTFRQIISAQDCVGVDNNLTKTRMLVAEQDYPFLFAPNQYPCYVCLKVIDQSGFDKDFLLKRALAGAWPGFGANARPLGDPRAYQRE